MLLYIHFTIQTTNIIVKHTQYNITKQFLIRARPSHQKRCNLPSVRRVSQYTTFITASSSFGWHQFSQSRIAKKIIHIAHKMTRKIAISSIKRIPRAPAELTFRTSHTFNTLTNAPPNFPCNSDIVNIDPIGDSRSPRGEYHQQSRLQGETLARRGRSIHRPRAWKSLCVYFSLFLFFTRAKPPPSAVREPIRRFDKTEFTVWKLGAARLGFYCRRMSVLRWQIVARSTCALRGSITR